MNSRLKYAGNFKKKTPETFDSRMVEGPKALASANGFPEKCFVSPTLRNGRSKPEIIEYSGEDEREVDELSKSFPVPMRSWEKPAIEDFVYGSASKY